MCAPVKSPGCVAFVLLMCLFSSFAVLAQPRASFTASNQSGCSPLVVHFSDQSAKAPTQWRWDLGNGVISTLQNPSATYFNPGTYTVKLLVRNASGADSVIKQNFITVYANPVVDFSASDTNGCFPLPVQFTSLATAGSGEITRWQWDFGDGSVSSEANPKHVYQSAGQFDVSLQITNSFGCIKTFTKTQHIQVAGGVAANFSWKAAASCTAPVSVQFNNDATGSGSLTYHWSFGDGATSAEPNPQHTYTNKGNYTVAFTVTNSFGCSSTLQREQVIHVGTNRSSFLVADTVCTGANISFVNTSAPQPAAAQWLIDGAPALQDINLQKIFEEPGQYRVTLVNDFGSCQDSFTKQLMVIPRLQPAFNAPVTRFCAAPATVQFKSETIGATTVQWLFGDGSVATGAQPVHTYKNFGSYDVTVIVGNASGCTDTLIKKNFIEVRKPEIKILGLPQTGCTPLKVLPSATVAAASPVVSYLWRFGDGATSTQQNPEHIYTAAGNYNVTLVITTESGCTDSVTLTNAVRAGNKPQANFAALQQQVCNANPVQFVDSSKGNVDGWLWFFGDRLTATDQNPAHVFDGIGKYDVTLIAFSNTCPDTITIKQAVNVLPPLSIFSVKRSCTNKYRVDFADESVGATRVAWDFGDGSQSTQRNTTHTYAAPGLYKVVYRVYNETCWNINWTYIKIVDEEAAITATDTAVCKNVPVQFASPARVDSNIVKWEWNFGDGTVATQPLLVTHSFKQPGTYAVRLSITDINGCVSADTLQVRVYGPAANFTINNSAACLADNNVQMNNTTTDDGSHSIVKSIWRFGDGTTDALNRQQVKHHYAAPGTYSIQLMVEDEKGCTDVVMQENAVTIAQPTANFFTTDSLSCTGKSIAFENTSLANNASFKWSFGDGTTATTPQPVHRYLQVGTYGVQLIVTDQYGCKDTLYRKNYVQISLPEAKFSVSDSAGNCPPLIVNFTNQSKGYVSLQWLFGDGNSSVLPNPTHFYNTAGTFYAKLVVTGPGGCSDTAVQKITVKGPSGQITYTPLSGCNPLAVQFTATSKNTTSFLWDFSDGHTQPGNSVSVNHTYTNPGEFVPKLILTDASGCNVPIVGADTIKVFEVTAGFTTNAASFCKAGVVQFSNKSVSNDLITAYRWNFGDGNYATAANPVHTYLTAGTYTVTLTAFTQSGCSHTYTSEAAVTILPAPKIAIEGDEAACVPAAFRFSGMVQVGNAAALSWQWNLGNGQKSSEQHPSAQTYTADGQYTITAIATAENGCMDTATKIITVHPLPLVNAGANTAICLGTTVTLQATGAEKYVWNEAPTLSCATCAAPQARPNTNTTYVVEGYSRFGCSKKDSVLVVVHQPFQLAVSGNDSICAGGAVRLRASGAYQYQWLPATGVQQPNKGNTLAFPTATTQYQVIASDQYNCFKDTGYVQVKVWPVPTVQAGADQQLVVGETLQLKASVSNDVSALTWSPAASLSCATCPVTLAHPKQTTTYQVQVKNEGGCTATDDVTVNVICNNGNLFLPNAFSPNGDGVNDRFFPAGSGINRIKSFTIFNRWGEIVFQRSNFAANDNAGGWDGTFKGQLLPPDVYIWHCDVICQNNETLGFKGDVTLLR